MARIPLTLRAIPLLALITTGCSQPTKHVALPSIRLDFSRLYKLKKEVLGVSYEPSDRADEAFVWAFGIRPSNLMVPRDAGELHAYRVTREDLNFYTDRTDYVLTFFKRREFADWPARVLVSIGNQRIEAKQGEPFDDKFPQYISDNVPPTKFGATALKETDIKYVVLKPVGLFDNQPKIDFRQPYAVYDCSCDKDFNWKGTIIGFTPDVSIPAITVDGKKVPCTNRTLQVFDVSRSWNGAKSLEVKPE